MIFDKQESYLHDAAKTVFVEGICGKTYKEGNFYPSDIEIYAKKGEVEHISGVGSCDVAWNFTIEKEIMQLNKLGQPYRSFVPDIYIFDECTNDIRLIEIVHTNGISQNKFSEIKKWISYVKANTPHCGDIMVYQIPAIDILNIDKYSHAKDSHSWKFPFKFLEKYEVLK